MRFGAKDRYRRGKSLSTFPNQKKGDRFGSYGYGTLSRIARALSAEDLTWAFRWILTEPPSQDQTYEFRELTDELLTRGLEHVGARDTFACLIIALDARSRLDDSIRGNYRKSRFIEQLRNQTAERRIIVEALVKIYTPDDLRQYPLSLSLASLIFSNDFSWLMERALDDTNLVRKEILVMLARRALNYDDVDSYAQAYLAQTTDEVVRQHFGEVFDAVPLDSEAATMGREYRHLSATPESEELNAGLANLDSDIEGDLSLFESGDWSGWWRLNYRLLINENGMMLSEYTVDIRRYPGWQRASETRRKRLIAAARAYVLGADTSELEWQTSQYRPGASGYRALFLLAAEQPDFMTSLSSQIWKKWAKAIVTYPADSFTNDEVEVDTALLQAAFENAGPKSQDQLDTLLDEPENRKDLQ